MAGAHEGPGQRNPTDGEGEGEERVSFRTWVGVFRELIEWWDIQ